MTRHNQTEAEALAAIWIEVLALSNRVQTVDAKLDEVLAELRLTRRGNNDD